MEDVSHALLLQPQARKEFVIALQRNLVLQVHSRHHSIHTLIVHFGKAEAAFLQEEMAGMLHVVLIEAALVGEIPHILRDITNVIGFLGETKGGDPVPMRQAEVNRILGTVDELAEQPEEISIPYFVGESVKVTDGPFNGFTGVIEEVNSDKKRLKVIVKIFGRKTPLELSYMQVEKE